MEKLLFVLRIDRGITSFYWDLQKGGHCCKMKQYQDWRLVSNLLNLNIITHMLLFAYYSVCILSLVCFCLGQERKDQRLLTANTVLPKRQQKSELWYNLNTIYIFLLVMPESRKAATSMKAATCQLYTIGKEVISRKKGRVPSH